MTEGSVYDRELAALAIKQARGDLVEAIFLLRAYRTTLPRFGDSEPIDTGAMDVERRISATFKDLPGGQVLGPTFDYTHRLIDFALCRKAAAAAAGDSAGRSRRGPMPRVGELLGDEGLIEAAVPAATTSRRRSHPRPADFPGDARLRLQNLARGDEGFLLALGYSTQRGYGRNHPFVGEIRIGEVEVEIVRRRARLPVEIGEIDVTECEMVNQFKGSPTRRRNSPAAMAWPSASAERKAMAMALVDRALRAEELGEEVDRAGAGPGIRAVPFRQCRGAGLRPASEAAALRRFPGRARPRRMLRAERGGRGAQPAEPRKAAE